MSRIQSIQAIPLSFRLPEGKTVKLGIGSTIKRDAIIVRVQTECGVVGYGEAHPGRSPGAVTSLIANTLAPLVTGMDAFDTNGVWSRIHKMQLASHGLGAGAALALSGIDMALWDARGKLCNQPLYKLLGGSSKPIQAYAGGIALGFQAPESLAGEALTYIDRGYRALKLRLGDTVANDAARVAHVRSVLGDDIDILTDVNAAYSIDEVRRLMPALEDARVGWLEEPFACDNFGAYRAAGALGSRVPLAAGENHYTRYDFAQLLEERAVQVFQPDLSKTGGVTEGMRIAALVSAWGYKVHPHSSATGLNHAACVHMLAAVDNPGYFEACVSHFNPFRDMFGPAFATDADGCVKPLEKPGLGLEIDEAVFSDFPFIDGPGYVVKF
ncbi:MULTISPECIES: mandelate racemase/muconate lactonizing enzyme family protein [unclassified Cupriavidus]|uniref:mandelate racemase/muconate lactonizing enzyme family protein n=1 Tax=Cupriavidus sp. H19C3 TaxID=3241603 RepID=UPI003BF8AF75